MKYSDFESEDDIDLNAVEGRIEIRQSENRSNSVSLFKHSFRQFQNMLSKP